MSRAPSRIVLTGLVAFAMIGVAYPAAYFLLVRKQFKWMSLPATALGGGSGGSATTHTLHVSVSTIAGFSFLGSPSSAPVFTLSPCYGALLGLPEVSGAETALHSLFSPLHECDRRFLRVHDWSAASIFGCTKPGPQPWYAVKSHP
jgi:hypothetical protein